MRTTSHVRSLLEKPALVPIYNASWSVLSKSCTQGLKVSRKLVSSSTTQKGMIVSSVNASDATETSKSDGEVITYYVSPRMV